MAASMLGLIVISCLFALFVLLLIKSPTPAKMPPAVLICLVMASVFGVRLFGSGAGPKMVMTPVIFIVVPFVFVLLIGLLTKAPKAGIGVLVALVALVALGLAAFVAIPVSHRHKVAVVETHVMDRAVLPRSVA